MELHVIRGSYSCTAYLWSEHLINNNNIRGIRRAEKCATCIIKDLQ